MKMIFSIVTMMCFIGAAIAQPGSGPAPAPVPAPAPTTPASPTPITWPKLVSSDTTIPATDRYLPLDRFQWNNNGGYCGETSFQMALLHAGTWASQYTIREVVNAKKQSYADKNLKLPQQQQFLLSVNDLTTAAGMNVKATEYMANPENGIPGANTLTKDFLVWVKKQMRAGNQVSIGLMVALDQAGKGAATHFDTFDHIVSVSHITSLYDDDLYHDTDLIGIYDHLVATPEGEPPKFARGLEYAFGDTEFIMSRTDCDKNRKYTDDAYRKKNNYLDLPKDPKRMYCLTDASTNFGAGNFGVAYGGSVDKQTYPVVVSSSSKGEGSENIRGIKIPCFYDVMGECKCAPPFTGEGACPKAEQYYYPYPTEGPKQLLPQPEYSCLNPATDPKNPAKGLTHTLTLTISGLTLGREYKLIVWHDYNPDFTDETKWKDEQSFTATGTTHVMDYVPTVAKGHGKTTLGGTYLFRVRTAPPGVGKKDVAPVKAVAAEALSTLSLVPTALAQVYQRAVAGVSRAASAYHAMLRGALPV